MEFCKLLSRESLSEYSIGLWKYILNKFQNQYSFCKVELIVEF